jgi:mannitol 2-dehydrogenase
VAIVLTSDARPLNATTLAHHGSRVRIPHYQRHLLRPSVVHIGVGGFHRSHQATYLDDLCRAGNRDWAICGSGVLADDASMAEALAAQDNLYSLIVRSAGETTVSVIGSIVGYIHAHPDPRPLIEQIAHPDTQIVSLTVTEGGYPIDDATGHYAAGSPAAGQGSTFAVLAEALQVRRVRGANPITVMSCDNIMANGHATRTATLGEAERLDSGLVNWIERNVAFPSSMVDRITPATATADREWLADELGLLDRWPVVAEPFRQWVIEDRFAAEAPPLADAGVVLTDDVEPYEKLKLRLLNAGHSCLAYLAALLGIELVDQAMADAELYRFVETLLDDAGLVLSPAPGIDLDGYKASLLNRFANPAIGDQISRLCLDGSAKFPKFLMPTIRARLDAGCSVAVSALGLAGWCQYLLGTAESGKAIDISADPQLDVATEHARASVSEPRAFLGFTDVFETDVAANPTFVDAFERGLSLIRTSGVRSAIDTTLSTRGST